MCVCFRSKTECCSVCRRDGGWSLWGTLHHYSVSHQQVKTQCPGQWYVSEVFLIWQCVCVLSPERCSLSSWRWPLWCWWTHRAWGTPDTALTTGLPDSPSSVTTTYRRDCWSFTTVTHSHRRWSDTHGYCTENSCAVPQTNIECQSCWFN